MFGGIVQGICHVVSVRTRAEIVTLSVRLPDGAASGIQIGASVALNGCCLTAVSIEGDQLTFDLVQETLQRTNLGDLKEGSPINFERSLKIGDEVGGHLVSGHVDTVATIISLSLFEHSKDISLQLRPEWTKFVFEKGYIALNGASLTVACMDRGVGAIRISLIPETLKRTTFGISREGDGVNVEVDRATQAIVSTVERVLENRKEK